MRFKSLFSMVFACIIAVSCSPTSAGAISADNREFGFAVRATGKFSMDIPANTLSVATTDFPLEVGETVSINAVYSPESASVDFGLIAPDGLFYPVTATDGSFDETIEVDQRGNYTLAVRNNSSETISVSGFVTY